MDSFDRFGVSKKNKTKPRVELVNDGDRKTVVRRRECTNNNKANVNLTLVYESSRTYVRRLRRNDLPADQRSTLTSIGYTKESWNESMGFAKQSTQEKGADDEKEQRPPLTLKGIHEWTTFQLRQELERRERYDPEKDGSPCYKTFLRIMVSILEEEEKARELKTLHETEKRNEEARKRAQEDRKKRKETTRLRLREAREAVETKRDENIVTSVASHVPQLDGSIRKLRLPRRF